VQTCARAGFEPRRKIDLCLRSGNLFCAHAQEFLWTLNQAFVLTTSAISEPSSRVTAIHHYRLYAGYCAWPAKLPALVPNYRQWQRLKSSPTKRSSVKCSTYR